MKGASTMPAKKTTKKAKNSPWSIRDITPEAKTMAKKAAKKADKKIGEWLNDAIMKVGSEELSHSHVPAIPIEDTLSEIMNEIKTLKENQNKGLMQKIFGKKEPKNN